MILRRPSEAVETEKQLTCELKAELPQVLSKFYRYFGKEISVHQFHARIGGKNNTYTDCVRTQFEHADEFVASWIDGLLRRFGQECEERRIGKRASSDTAAGQLVKLLGDNIVRSYVIKFLKRNFHRQFIPRTRYKPPDNLWSLWFGSGQMTYGLLTSPAFRGDQWKNDVSEIRRAPFVYWTVGHLLSAGLVAPEEKRPMTFNGLTSLLSFYRFVLKKLSRSTYERAIAEEYCNYLEQSSNASQEPFLIPEFRYGGLEAMHKFRLDFTVLNGHVARFTGFELSPHSSHGAIRGMKGKKQKDLNAELSRSWENEMNKRNSYFREFNIPVVTFTDTALMDAKSCFGVIAEYLSERSRPKLDLKSALAKLESV